MSATTFMPLYVADYLGDTQHLTTEQHGAYMLLLMAMWRTGGRLPNDSKKLCRIARVHPPHWSKVAADVMEFFNIEGDFITHDRLLKELEKAHQKSQSRTQAGRLGGTAKSLKNNKTTLANASGLPEHLPESESEQERKEEKKEQNNQSFPTAARVPDRPSDDFVECKSAFNGSTARMLDAVETAMGPSADRRLAEAWLANLARINGSDAVAQSFQMLLTAKAENHIIARILPWWSKTAATLKSKPSAPAYVTATSDLIRRVATEMGVADVAA